jgi:hypothetical protein
VGSRSTNPEWLRRALSGEPIPDRFHRRYVVAENGCWIWIGHSDANGGYGLLNINNGKPAWAHRLSYELHVGPIPKGLVIDHLCRQRNCVNWRHLEPVTNAENLRRARLTHCKRGHEKTPENCAGERRQCRACLKLRRKKKRRLNWVARRYQIKESPLLVCDVEPRLVGDFDRLWRELERSVQ